MARELTLWNQAVGNTIQPRLRSTMSSARKVNELPACSKNIQNRMLKAKMISIAMVLSRATAPFLTPSISSVTASAVNIAVSTHCKVSAPSASRKYATGITTIDPMIT